MLCACVRLCIHNYWLMWLPFAISRKPTQIIVNGRDTPTHTNCAACVRIRYAMNNLHFLTIHIVLWCAKRERLFSPTARTSYHNSYIFHLGLCNPRACLLCAKECALCERLRFHADYRMAERRIMWLRGRIVRFVVDHMLAAVFDDVVSKVWSYRKKDVHSEKANGMNGATLDKVAFLCVHCILIKKGVAEWDQVGRFRARSTVFKIRGTSIR